MSEARENVAHNACDGKAIGGRVVAGMCGGGETSAGRLDRGAEEARNQRDQQTKQIKIDKGGKRRRK